MQRFLAAPHAVLVGSQSFWEGIDVPGEALHASSSTSCRSRRRTTRWSRRGCAGSNAEGRNPFADYFVAEAAISLKQGAGRLIRSETDRGACSSCATRAWRDELRPAPVRGAAADDAHATTRARRSPGSTAVAAGALSA